MNCGDTCQPFHITLWQLVPDLSAHLTKQLVKHLPHLIAVPVMSDKTLKAIWPKLLQTTTVLTLVFFNGCVLVLCFAVAVKWEVKVESNHSISICVRTCTLASIICNKLFQLKWSWYVIQNVKWLTIVYQYLNTYIAVANWSIDPETGHNLWLPTLSSNTDKQD